MTYKRKISSIIVSMIILVLLFGGSCGLLGGDDSKKKSDELRPLAVGNWWEYEYNLFSLKDTVRYEVAKEIQVPWGGTSYTAYGYNRVPLPPEIPEFYWLNRNGEAGLYQMGGIAETDTLFTNNIRRWYPAEEGQTWEVPRLSFSRDSLNFYVSDTLDVTLVDTNREIETPAGTFECYVYKFTIEFEGVLRGWDYYMHYSPGVGLVAQISTSEGKPENIKEEMYLMNYRVE